ncbi:hypothetical protein MesoLj131c_21950 [Mesorhizobium sp. 131-3-5]|uniref:hypothetical protein n=1 Tax=Mesorhizobium sp. 131-3-5 TaxID=2744520 RepID=UPI00193505E6|nr:hypothetical protein [Mesorhizobium sp. 131-3-5]BCH07937.1 hypothetical protein MesoLj131c_21950 [Mesorhizobium sp. 131-3-5]
MDHLGNIERIQVDLAERRRFKFHIGTIEFVRSQLRQCFGRDGNDGVFPGLRPGEAAVDSSGIDDKASDRRIVFRDLVAAERGSEFASGLQHDARGMFLGQERLRPGTADGMDDAATCGGSSGTGTFWNDVQDISGYPIDASGNAAFPSFARIFHSRRLSRLAAA